MPKRRDPNFINSPTGTFSDGPAVAPTQGLTGRYIVLFHPGKTDAGVQALEEDSSLKVASTKGTEAGILSVADQTSADAVVFDKIGVAVVSATPQQLQSLNIGQSASAIASIRPERYLYASSGMLSVSTDYLHGYQAGVDHLVEALLGTSKGASSAAMAQDETSTTWGLQATQVIASKFSGQGIRVAILDTGLDLTHPDFAGRNITRQSFVDGVATAQDGHGHGTHCTGTSCGPQNPAVLPRYGIAYNADIFIGKVLDDTGKGAEQAILAGINWAITNQCKIVSMSLGRPVGVGEAPDPDYEAIGQRALDQGTLIIAAAGNDSSRPGNTAPVGAPANSSTIMAVAAIDASSQVAFFSNGGVNPGGGQIDVAGPGVDVYSSWLLPKQYNTISGTSMATPHVAGIAALLAEANPKASAHQLWSLLTQTAQRLPLPSTDVGSGLVQAP